MKLAGVLFSILLIMSAGCSTLHQVDLNEREQWLADARTNLVDHDAIMTTKDGRTADGRIVQITPDSVWFSNQWTIEPASFSLDELWSIQQPRNTGAPMGGLLGGALLGALIGANVGEEQSTVAENAFGEYLERGANRWGGAIYGLLIGAAAGAAILGAATSADEYQFHRTVRSTANGSQATATPDSLRPGE